MRQMACNYPLVRLTNNVLRGTSIMRGRTTGTAQPFQKHQFGDDGICRAAEPAGGKPISLVVAAVGNPSAPVTFYLCASRPRRPA